MKPELAHHLNKVRDTVAEVDRILDLHKYPDDPRTVFVSGLLALMDQHHHGVLLLIKSGADSSALALARDIIVGTRYGLWINSCATSDQILSIPKADQFILSIPEMNREIGAAYQGDPFFVEMRDRWAAKLYHYTVEEVVRLGHTSIDPKSGLPQAHEDEEAEDVMTVATLCIVLLASKFLATQKHADESKQVEALAAAYVKESPATTPKAATRAL